jgi:hypothetical protein
MQDNTVAIEPGPECCQIRFATRFNLAVPFIDRHLAEGRGAKVAIRTATEAVTYAELAERVARCGNALLGLGIKPGDRLGMVVLDGPEFFYLFWGAVKAGIVPVPLNTLLRAADYAYMIDDSACTGLAYSPALAAEVEPGLALATHRPVAVFRVSGPGESLPALLAAASPGRSTIATGSIPPARPGGRRGRATPTATRWSPASTTGSRPWGSGRTTCSSPPPSCFSPTGSATRWPSRCGSAAPRS